MQNQRRKFSADFKAKVALEALKEQKTLSQLAEQYEIHPTQITEWKKQAQERMAGLFGDAKGEKQVQQSEAQVEKLYAQIGQLKVENDFLKKKLK
jgi:transposase